MTDQQLPVRSQATSLQHYEKITNPLSVPPQQCFYGFHISRPRLAVILCCALMVGSVFYYFDFHLSTKDSLLPRSRIHQGGDPFRNHSKHNNSVPFLSSVDRASNDTTLFQSRRDQIREAQIRSYMHGRGIIYSIHITHHAGTSLCDAMKHIGPTPSFNCMDKEFTTGWSRKEISSTVKKIREKYHFISKEFQNWRENFGDVNWEYEDMVSVIIMRDPLERFLAGGKCGEYHEKRMGPLDTPSKWWDYANSDCADNFALKILSPYPTCCSGSHTDPKHLDGAKQLLRRFTFIIDQECLNESMIAKVLNITNYSPSTIDRHHKIHLSARERINNDTLFEFLNHRFQQDINLYKWSKRQSIVKDC